MGVYADAAGPVGREPRHRHRHGRRLGPLVVPVALIAARHRAACAASRTTTTTLEDGLALLPLGRRADDRGRRLRAPPPRSTAARASTRPPTSWSTPAASSAWRPPDRSPPGIAPWGAGLILGALVLAGLVVLTRVPVRAAAETHRGRHPPGRARARRRRQARRRQPLLARRRVRRRRTASALFDQDADDLHRPRRRAPTRGRAPAPPAGPAQAEGAAPRARRAGARPSSSRSSSARR